ncbi:MAG: hypothetical protein D6834_00270 [Aquificota bacterium]|nr:MAG: hypothetical protein D6834_00270 [Aquificota bacterium]
MKGYILNLYTKERIEFKDGTGRIVMLNDVSESKEANYNTEETLGRSEGYLIYANSSNKTISFSIGFYFDNPEKTHQIKQKFESLVYPSKQGNIPIPPPPVLLVWGNYYKIRGVVKSFQATPNNRWSLKYGLPYGIDINLEIVEVNLKPKYHKEVWK